MPTTRMPRVAGELHQQRRLVVARHAPRRPDVDDRHRALEVAPDRCRAPARRCARGRRPAAGRSAAPAGRSARTECARIAGNEAEEEQSRQREEHHQRQQHQERRLPLGGAASFVLLGRFFGGLFPGSVPGLPSLVRSPLSSRRRERRVTPRRLEIGENAPLRRIVDHDPGHSRRPRRRR